MLATPEKERATSTSRIHPLRRQAGSIFQISLLKSDGIRLSRGRLDVEALTLKAIPTYRILSIRFGFRLRSVYGPDVLERREPRKNRVRLELL